MKVKSNSEIQQFLQEELIKQGITEITIEEVLFKQGKSPSLTVFIEKEGGVDLNSCELVHNAIDESLDVFDPTFGETYTLNVSSLGADRPFKTDADLEKNVGKGVEVKLNVTICGSKFHEGELIKYNNESIVIKNQKQKIIAFDRKNIIKISKQIIF